MLQVPRKISRGLNDRLRSGPAAGSPKGRWPKLAKYVSATTLAIQAFAAVSVDVDQDRSTFS